MPAITWDQRNSSIREKHAMTWDKENPAIALG
jgi:hypothetical protein